MPNIKIMDIFKKISHFKQTTTINICTGEKLMATTKTYCAMMYF